MAKMLSTPKSIKEVINGEDGHVYYVIASEGKEIRMGIIYLERYEDLNLHIGQPGLFFVRNAAAKHQNPNDFESPVIQNGDPSVHEGWAMYCWDTNKTNTTAGWRKIAEQESVDGPWGIDERILKMLVKRSEFNSFVEQYNIKIQEITGAIQVNYKNIEAIKITVEGLSKISHSHNNKETLDKFGNNFGVLTFDGVILGGSFYVYNQITDGSLVWKDPTDPKAAPEDVATAFDIANKFVLTPLAAKNMVLTVVETDGSLTSFDIIEKSDGESTSLVAVLHGCIVHNGTGQITYVDKLDDTRSYVNRGVFCPLTDDGIYKPFELYVYDELTGWISLKAKYGEGTEIDKVGAIPVLCHMEEDPEVPYKKIHLFWADDTAFNYTDPETNVMFSWDHTVIVRKFGSVPQNPSDGTVVFISRDPADGSNGFMDVCPYSNLEVFYQIFTVTKHGAYCKAYNKDGIVSRSLDWKTIRSMLNGSSVYNNIREKIFPIGCTLVLPHHPVFGKIPCKLIHSTGTELTLATERCLDTMEFSDTTDWYLNMFMDYTKYKLTNDGRAVPGKSYKYFDTENGFTDMDINAGDAFPEGLLVYESDPEYPNGIVDDFGLPSDSTPGIENIDVTIPLYRNKSTIGWWKEDGSKSAESDKTGVIAVFTIKA